MKSGHMSSGLPVWRMQATQTLQYLLQTPSGFPSLDFPLHPVQLFHILGHDSLNEILREIRNLNLSSSDFLFCCNTASF